jgi:hypothetical protein
VTYAHGNEALDLAIKGKFSNSNTFKDELFGKDNFFDINSQKASEVLSTKTNVFGKDSAKRMDIAIGSFAEPQRNNADISAKEVISRVMSKAEIKKQALKSNNKDYLLDFIEEKPVKEYSKEPESTMLNLDFKKKKSQKEVVGGSKNSSSTGLDFLKDTSISTEIYLDKLMSHINNLKVISSSKISLHQNTGINELNKLNNAFESLKT